MGRAIGTRKRSKGVKLSAAITKLDLEEGRSQRPTEQEYARMVIYNSFVVSNEEDTEFKFERDQVVLVLPHGFDPNLNHSLSVYWAARIKDIRANSFDDGSNSVWVRVQWYYSGKDVSDVIKSFDRNAIGPFERIFSDHVDFIQPEAFEMVIPMYKLNEVDPEQIFIPRDSFYRRYTFEYLARNLQPKPGLLTCLCQKPYNPNDTDIESLMHFCPRPSCRIAFHHRCLVNSKSKESSTTTQATTATLTVKIPDYSQTPTPPMEGDTIKVVRSARKQVPLKKASAQKVKMIKEGDDETEVAMAIMPSSVNASGIKIRRGQPFPLPARSLRLLGCSPDTDENIDLHDLVYSTNRMDVDSDIARVSDDEPEEAIVVSQKRRRGRPPKKRSKGKATQRPTAEIPTLDSVLKTIPSDLLTIAIQPLVRGGAFAEGGVAGNIGMVTRARRLVHTALQMGGGPNVLPDWEETVFGVDREVVAVGLKNAVVHVVGGQTKKDKGLPPFVCPNCKSAI